MDEILKEDIEDVREKYGDYFLENILKNKELVDKNISVLKEYGIMVYSEIFALYPELFLSDPRILRSKLLSLIQQLGPDMALQIENDLSLLEGLL